MTAKNIGGPSLPGDKYYTPKWCIDQCMEHVLPVALPVGDPQKILEPSAGAGGFVRALRKSFPDSTIHAFDIDETAGPWSPHADEGWYGNYFDMDANWEEYNLVVGNPPFTHAMKFIQKSLEISEYVVFILRQGFMSSQKRAAWFRQNPPTDVFILSHRPSFTGDGNTDSADYCWIVWKAGYQGETKLHWLPEVPKEIRRSK